jgi:hypothetical protein
MVDCILKKTLAALLTTSVWQLAVALALAALHWL